MSDVGLLLDLLTKSLEYVHATSPSRRLQHGTGILTDLGSAEQKSQTRLSPHPPPTEMLRWAPEPQQRTLKMRTMVMGDPHKRLSHVNDMRRPRRERNLSVDLPIVSMKTPVLEQC